jgi:hypothetical protein
MKERCWCEDWPDGCHCDTDQEVERLQGLVDELSEALEGVLPLIGYGSLHVSDTAAHQQKIRNVLAKARGDQP